ncbi:Serine/threonine-protein phosphatase 6 regulatory subunit 3 [Holothuria leucospilota]|uniref:Serine/threonine-protein phosphatase 6 regulatory subunit 3 n=1 Tax=Holothuria leucospilota TaxID=206669 RepID=A0A9Q1H4K5_HOLLE|nr:Serine/threonine-protein phosphatase 6 regulatory subunit 3 [Holothuria leucospilota]
MFWKFDMRPTSHIDALLEKEDVTLAEILEEDDVLQECKAQNKKLIEFLSKETVVEELVDLITQEPPTDLDDSIQYKHPNMACELLTADVSAITDKLADTENIFNKLWNFLDCKPPLNPLLASFFSKTVGSLLARRPELVIDHIKKQEDCLGIFFKHLETSAIMDLILRLITCIDSQELRTPFLEWLNDQKFIQRLVDLIDPEQSEEVHSNAAQTLCDIIRLTREHMSQLQECAEIDPLLSTIEMQETVTELLEHMFRGKRAESALVNGVAVLLSLLEFKKQSDTFLFPSPEGQEQMTQLDAERLAKGVSGTLKAIVPKLSELHQLLKDPPRNECMHTTVGKLEPPFGNVRLQVCKLISSLLVTNTPAINSELARLGTIKALWDLFFEYLWNNFLHLEVEKSIGTILTNSAAETEEEGKLQHPLLVHLFTECKLVQRIIEMWEANDSSQQQGGKRRGNMGHLTRIANCLSQELEKGCNSEQIKSLMEEYVPEDYRDRWTNFVSGPLAEMNKKNIVDMVGTNAFHSSSDDDEQDFRDIDFGKDTALQQAFSDYQMQQMTSHFIDQFGFTEEEFTEQDQNVNNPFNRISDIDFSISANQDNPNSALFEACCNEKISSYNNSDDEYMWEEKEFTFAGETNSNQRERSRKEKDDNGNDSSDSDDALGDDDFPPVHHPKPLPSQDDIRMDVDQGDNWVANFDDIPMDSSVPMDAASSAWQMPAQATSENGGWANFDAFNTDLRASSDISVAPRSSSPVEMDSTPSHQVSSQSTSGVSPSTSSPSSYQTTREQPPSYPQDPNKNLEDSLQDRIKSQGSGTSPLLGSSLQGGGSTNVSSIPPSVLTVSPGRSTTPSSDESINQSTSETKDSVNPDITCDVKNDNIALSSSAATEEKEISSGHSQERNSQSGDPPSDGAESMHVIENMNVDSSLGQQSNVSKLDQEAMEKADAVKSEDESSSPIKEAGKTESGLEPENSLSIMNTPDGVNDIPVKQTSSDSVLSVKPNGPVGIDNTQSPEKKMADNTITAPAASQNGPV